MRHIVLFALVLCGSTLACLASAQSTGGEFAITRDVIAGGGARATGGDFSVVSTVAQPASGPAPGGMASGGVFTLRGGFHLPTGEAPPLGNDIFNDGFEGSTP